MKKREAAMTVTVTSTIESDEIQVDSELMSYDYLNGIYDKSITIVDEGYTTIIGGVTRPWDVFNSCGTLTIKDSVTFAQVQSKYGLSNKFVESAWKIHLSIQPDDLGKAWDIIYPLLKTHKVHNFKTSRLAVSRTLYTQMQEATPAFLKQNIISEDEKNQSIQDLVRVFNGMQVTLYIENGKEREFNDILAEIEPLLYKAGINPGIIDKSDRAIGLYSSIRHVGKGYASHNQVTGYKEVDERDLFSAIYPKFKDVHINWGTFDYTRHILKAKSTLGLVTDARRKYDTEQITKREFNQICDVAAEYFGRWHDLLTRMSYPSNLSVYNKHSLTKLRKWFNEGYQLVPRLRKDPDIYFKEAEEVLQLTGIYTVFDIPRPRIRRNAGHRNLLNLLPKSQYLANEPLDTVSKNECTDSAITFKTLFARKKNIFSTLKSCPIPQIKFHSSLHHESTNESQQANDAHKKMGEAISQTEIEAPQGAENNIRAKRN